ncbi:SWPV1-138 [Shearwaterpox virus]|uniref:Assembly protein G7 n=1 Tax=Shearwaterpox virus TaxID=1974596 RepID=A0A1V0QGU6_CNPV|nr:SWPV1-138 [Shearwaterpox virus]
MEEQKQSEIFNIVSKSLVETLLQDLMDDKAIASIVARAKYIYNSANTDAIINSIYQKCESEISIPTIAGVKSLLDKTYTYGRHVQDESEFNELRSILTRLSHNKSFFITCNYLINTTAATLLTLILSNQLIHAAKIVSEIETYLFDPKKSPASEISDLLEMKYAILKFAQYKIFPIVIGYKELDTIAGGKVMSFSDEISMILDMPLKSPKLDEMYKKMADNGMFLDSYAEYVAGLRIQEVNNTSQPTDTSVNNQLSTYIANNNKILDMAYKYSKGHDLDGAVTSPLSDDDRIRLTNNDLRKFAILDYLYTIRVLANCIKKKKMTPPKKPGTTLTINSPYKIVTVPSN